MVGHGNELDDIKRAAREKPRLCCKHSGELDKSLRRNPPACCLARQDIAEPRVAASHLVASCRIMLIGLIQTMCVY